MSNADPIPGMVEQLAGLLRAQHRTLATIESCTGGLVGAALTALSGISDVYVGGLITYSNQIKHLSAGVHFETLDAHGAVSAQAAIEMARGGCRKMLATNAISITGIAGPDGGTPDKPVGTVWICAVGSEGDTDCRRFNFRGEREDIRKHAVVTSLQMMIQHLKDEPIELDHQSERLGA